MARRKPKRESKPEAERAEPPAPAPSLLARWRRWLFPIAVAAAVVACAIAMALSGARFGASTVALVAAAGLVVVALRTLLGAARSLTLDSDEPEEQRATGRRKKELEREKQALLKALKELEFDHEMRKISDRDHAEIAANYRARALRVMRQLDQAGVDYQRLIEYDLAAHRALYGDEPSDEKTAPAGDLEAKS